MKPRWLLTLSALALFAVLVVMSSSGLETVQGGAFDARLFGYKPADAQSYLIALSADQIALYTGAFRVLDTVFPLLLAASLVIWTRDLVQRPWRIAVFGLAGLYLAADLTENALVGRLLAAGPDEFDPARAGLASLSTQVKWAALGFCLAGLIGAGVRRRA